MPVEFTDEQKRLVNTYYPGLGVVPPNVGSGGLLGIIATAVDAAIAAGPTADAAAAQADADAAQADATQALADAAAAQADADANTLKTAMLTREVAAAGGKLELLEGTGNGVHKVVLQAPASLAADRVITVPDADVTLVDIASTKAALALVVSGQATILNGQTSTVVAVGAGFDGKRAVVSFAEAPTAAARIYVDDVSGGNLTIHINADNTANLKVNYLLDGRA